MSSPYHTHNKNFFIVIPLLLFSFKAQLTSCNISTITCPVSLPPGDWFSSNVCIPICSHISAKLWALGATDARLPKNRSPALSSSSVLPDSSGGRAGSCACALGSTIQLNCYCWAPVFLAPLHSLTETKWYSHMSLILFLAGLPASFNLPDSRMWETNFLCEMFLPSVDVD